MTGAESGGRERRNAVPERLGTGAEKREPQQTQSRQRSVCPLPDTSVSPDALELVGCRMDDLLPLSANRACELMEQGMAVYVVQTGENPAEAFDRNDILDQPEGTGFAISREEWEAIVVSRQTADMAAPCGMEAVANGG